MTIRLYHMLSSRYGLESLRHRRLKIARLHELNDPFEFFAWDLSNPLHRWALESTVQELSAKKGILCLSKTWRNPVLWSHYAERHHGLCLGFDVSSDVFWPVHYVEERPAIPQEFNTDDIKRLLFSKFSHWQYEQEYRAFISLREPEGHFYFIYFSGKLRLAEVIVGARSTVSGGDVQLALGDRGKRVAVYRARCASRSFEMERDEIPKDAA